MKTAYSAQYMHTTHISSFATHKATSNKIAYSDQYLHTTHSNKL